MPKFRLTPAPDRLSDPLWQRSQGPHEVCYVWAANEQKAREAAARHFRMSHAPTLTFGIGDNPWQNSELTMCTETIELIENMPIGLVYRDSDMLRRDSQSYG